jgi:hypothetical protein
LSLMPVPSEQSAATCANCGAALVADQRYCLTCGQPCSPVRLAFLDVLSDGAARPGAQAPPAWNVPSTIDMGAGGFLPPERGAAGWLRRNSGLMGLFTVLLLCLLVGLLVGHWAGQDRTPAQQVYKIEGLGGLAAAGGSGAAGTSSTSSEATPAASKSSAKQEAKEAAEGAKETVKEKAPPPAPKKLAPAKLQKLSTTTGKKHQEEINALGAQPIETG